MPNWCSRAGSVMALKAVATAMPVWQVVLSINGRQLRPCVAADETLAATLGLSRRTVQRRLVGLRSVAGLLLEIERPEPGTARRRPHARFATDPLSIWWITPRIIERLSELAEQDGYGTEWYRCAEVLVQQHDMDARNLAGLIREELTGAARQDGAERCRGGEGRWEVETDEGADKSTE